jgi:hypothetical protein
MGQIDKCQKSAFCLHSTNQKSFASFLPLGAGGMVLQRKNPRAPTTDRFRRIFSLLALLIQHVEIEREREREKKRRGENFSACLVHISTPFYYSISSSGTEWDRKYNATFFLPQKLSAHIVRKGRRFYIEENLDELAFFTSLLGGGKGRLKRYNWYYYTDLFHEAPPLWISTKKRRKRQKI